MGIHGQAWLHAEVDERCDGATGRLGGEVDDEVEVGRHPGVSVQDHGHAADDDEADAGAVERGQDRLVQGHAWPR